MAPPRTGAAHRRRGRRPGRCRALGGGVGPPVEEAVSLPVVLRPEASRDVEEARDHLEAQQAGLGQAFLDRLNETLARMGAMPELYGVRWRNVRAARLRRFTYV